MRFIIYATIVALAPGTSRTRKSNEDVWEKNENHNYPVKALDNNLPRQAKSDKNHAWHFEEYPPLMAFIFSRGKRPKIKLSHVLSPFPWLKSIAFIDRQSRSATPLIRCIQLYLRTMQFSSKGTQVMLTQYDVSCDASVSGLEASRGVYRLKDIVQTVYHDSDHVFLGTGTP